jgi:hypothetical protein
MAVRKLVGKLRAGDVLATGERIDEVVKDALGNVLVKASLAPSFQTSQWYPGDHEVLVEREAAMQFKVLRVVRASDAEVVLEVQGGDGDVIQLILEGAAEHFAKVGFP